MLEHVLLVALRFLSYAAMKFFRPKMRGIMKLLAAIAKNNIASQASQEV